MQNFVDAYSWINLRYLLQGLGVTLEVSIASIFFSFVLGVILGLARYVKIKYFSAAVGFVIDVIRNLPLLLILFFTYFALPDIGIRLNVIVAAIVAMSIFESAMLAEIVRSGINAVPRGQMEAARSNGLTFYQAMRYIIMPQALKKMIHRLSASLFRSSKTHHWQRSFYCQKRRITRKSFMVKILTT